MQDTNHWISICICVHSEVSQCLRNNPQLRKVLHCPLSVSIDELKQGAITLSICVVIYQTWTQILAFDTSAARQVPSLRLHDAEFRRIQNTAISPKPLIYVRWTEQLWSNGRRGELCTGMVRGESDNLQKRTWLLHDIIIDDSRTLSYITNYGLEPLT
jgi:hypothetical protein